MLMLCYLVPNGSWQYYPYCGLQPSSLWSDCFFPHTMLLTLNSTLSNSRVTASALSPFRLLLQVRKLVWEQKWCGCSSVSLCPAYMASLCGGRTTSHRGPCFSPGPWNRNVPISPRWGLFRSPSLIFSSLPCTGYSLVNKTQTLGKIQREKSHCCCCCC